MFSFLRPGARPAPPSVPELAARLARGEIYLLDVREPAEVRSTGKAKGALALPLGILALKADPAAPDAALRPDRPVAIYCASGGRSGMAAQMLQRLGYGEVWNIGGLGDWVAGGGQIEKA